MKMLLLRHYYRPLLIAIFIFIGICHFSTIKSYSSTQPTPPLSSSHLRSSPAVSRYNKVTCKEDWNRFKLISDGLLHETIKLEYFFKYLTFPIQTACRHLTRMGGGRWKRDVAWDGHKYICLDDFEDASEECLVYSFGLSNEWSFEEDMADFGCQVHGHDPTLKNITSTRKNLHIYKIGVYSDNSRGAKMKTFNEILKGNGHSKKVIHYLKVDIEGEELSSVGNWIKTGVLNNVLQVAFEFHDTVNRFKAYAKLCKSLHRLGFKLISYDPNVVTTPHRHFYSCVEVVFRRTKICGE